MAAEEWRQLCLRLFTPLGLSLGNIFSGCPFRTALGEKLHTQSQQTPQVLLHQPMANSSCSLDTHCTVEPRDWERAPKRQVETETGQTHQLFEEGGFLVLLRVALILVQAVLQLQSECVIVGSHDLQHLGEVKGQQGSVRTNSRSLGPMHAPPAALPH